MDNERVILHSDMNSFYASVEMMLNPELKGKPVAVCGSTEERHGIVLAKSDLAKKAGVKTGMVNWEARQLCPGLIVVPPQYDQYLKYSKLVLRFLSSAILKSANNFGIIILKSCSLQCVLHGAAKPPKAADYTVTAVSAHFYKHEINHEEVALCCQTRTPRTPIFSLLLIC